jgi:hypothetical protein
MEPGRALIENAEKKLREASSCLEQMTEQERMGHSAIKRSSISTLVDFLAQE